MNTRRILVLAICAVICASSLHVIIRALRQTEPITRYAVRPGAIIPAADRALRPNYPYSVIPGGAYSPAELRFVTQHDPMVQSHYSDFDVNAARLVVLTADRFQYASFRMKDHIFWTNHRLRIPKGEVLLSDGQNYARTRCGNRLSDTPKAETTPSQPADALLSLPPFRPELLAKSPIQLTTTPPIGELAQEHSVLPFESPRVAPYLPTGTPAELQLPESFAPSGGFAPIGSFAPSYAPAKGTTTFEDTQPSIISTPLPTPVVPAEVPEPRSLVLFGIVLCVSGCLLGRMAHASRRQRRSR
jgi:hypothetical protein